MLSWRHGRDVAVMVKDHKFCEPELKIVGQDLQLVILVQEVRVVLLDLGVGLFHLCLEVISAVVRGRGHLEGILGDLHDRVVGSSALCGVLLDARDLLLQL